MGKHNPQTPEGKASLKVLLGANRRGCRLYRNNSGVAYDQFNRPVFFGLGNEGKKSDDDLRTPDYVGFHKLTITPEMVGKTVPIFTAIDAKKLGFVCKEYYSKGSREYGQKLFFDIVEQAGGIAGFASSEEQVNEIIDKFYKRITS